MPQIAVSADSQHANIFQAFKAVTNYTILAGANRSAADNEVRMYNVGNFQGANYYMYKDH